MNKKEKDSESDSWLYIIGIISVFVIIGLWFFTYTELKDLPANERGTLGDMFGTVNALFSGLALAGIIFTILLQRKELGYQRKELQETRKEFVTQNKTLKNQKFENTIFNMLELHNQIVNDIDFEKYENLPESYETTTIKGRDVFKERFIEFNKYVKEEYDVNELYLTFYENIKTDFGHYFRNLYRIFKMIDENEFFTAQELNFKDEETKNKKKYELYNHIERYRYTSIVRSQLSDYELLFLFYNCLSDNGSEKFKPLVEEYALLKNIPNIDIKNKKLLDEYKSSAFEYKYKDKICKN